MIQKFGKEYVVNDDTYHMGIHQALGEHVATRFEECKVVLDACAGAGFMSLALARHVSKVIAVDINAEHLAQARENARIEERVEQIEFVEGDVLKVLPGIPFLDGAFLDPDWARPGDKKTIHVSALENMEPSATRLYMEVAEKTKNICLRLPKTFNSEELKKLPACEFEAVYLNDDLKFYCAYWGKLVKKEGNTEIRIHWL